MKSPFSPLLEFSAISLNFLEFRFKSIGSSVHASPQKWAPQYFV
ncbi:hypothetical protein QLQ80_02330 [Mycoplasma sp. M5725]|uniref:Uncharacterized protein n=1 Tax=Mycoplasma phocimorsus TaxID=3045839 RepID=A0AAJ1UX20_9MOLU|nr:hypothetical protein [Mycoplasma phocimorsus]MDJ1645910.1 hypothetical protein [Mycoplasma phocimorsus]